MDEWHNNEWLNEWMNEEWIMNEWTKNERNDEWICKWKRWSVVTDIQPRIEVDAFLT